MIDELPSGYPTINPAYVPVRANGTVHIRAGPWNAPSLTVRNEPTNGDEKLFDLLDGKHTLEEISERIGSDEQVKAVFEKLGEKNVLYFLEEESAYPVPRIPIRDYKPDVVEEHDMGSLQFSVATYGEIGSIVSGHLDRLGMDHDVIPLSRPEDVASLDVDEVDFVLYLATQNKPNIATGLNERLLEAEVPWLSGQVWGFDAVVGPTIVPGETSCYQCYLDRISANVTDQFYQFYHEGSKQIDSETTFTPLRYMVESYMCVELSHIAQYGQGFTVERTYNVSSIDMSSDVNDVMKAPRCDACAELEDRRRFVGFETMDEWGDR